MMTMTIAGNVGKDGANVRQAGNDQVCGFSVACSRKGKDGKDETTWFDVSFWGKRGAGIAPYIHQGDKVTVVGEFSQEEFNGKTRNRIRAYDVALQGGKRDNATTGNYGTSGAGRVETDVHGRTLSPDDSIPF